MTPFDLITIALFAWYTAYVLIKTSGPFGVFARVRSVTTVGGLLSCLWCLILWTSIAGYLLLGKPVEPQMIVPIGAAAGLGMLAHKYVGWDYQNG